MIAGRRIRLIVAAAIAAAVIGAVWPASAGAAEPVGHRLLASQKRMPDGEPGALGRLAVTRSAYREMWDQFRLRGDRPGVNWQKRRVLFVTTGESSICPLRFKWLRLIDETATLKLRAGFARNGQRVCTDDWTPRTFVVAVARDSIPKGKLHARANRDRRVQVRRIR